MGNETPLPGWAVYASGDIDPMFVHDSGRYQVRVRYSTCLKAKPWIIRTRPSEDKPWYRLPGRPRFFATAQSAMRAAGKMAKG